jgi:Protein of unknown function (DUF3179)
MWKRIAAALIPIVLIALVVVPLAIDQPFGSQTPRALAIAFTMRRWSPLISALGVVGLVALAVLALARHSAEGATAAWPRRRRWLAGIGFAAALAISVTAAWFARQNPFEWMFNPLPRPAFVAAEKATFVEPDDLVLSVSAGGDAAAYPIRQMAYHHLVNDRIGRTPAVVTY